MQSMKSFHYLLLSLTLLATACTPLTRTGEEPLSPEEIRIRAIEGKLTELTRRLNSIENKDESKLQDDMRNLRGEVERQRFELETQSRRSKDVDADIERRLQRLETGSAAATPPSMGDVSATTPPPVVYAPTATAPAPEASAGDGATAAQEQAAYLKAFEFLKAGKYDSAIVGFQSMLNQWPQGNFADNGWYWLGESQYVKRQYKPALDSYTALIERFPRSPKVPDALFKSGLTQVELKQAEQAKASWRRVMKDYPNSNAAGLARQRLAATP